eukprot:TRINITY_DN106775_c0_g1_i1.p1 TRINITY_DN106775_c0_g1~~TRINITY_DN106775_c0_g1_i1.p1  ORF type:complete len:360 (+),score=32.57 TRINITY_DN106775_c0_g1_i1:86-1165(+)
MNQGEGLQFLPGATVLHVQRPEGCLGESPSWQPGGKPAVLQEVDTAVWERFDTAVSNSVGRMQHEAKFCAHYTIAFVVGMIVCAILPQLMRFTDVRRLTPAEPELIQNALELRVQERLLQSKESTGDGYKKVERYDCGAHSYKQIWSVKSLDDCKSECDNYKDCCGFGYHREVSGHSEVPMCELRDFGGCSSCYVYSDSDYFFKEGYESPEAPHPEHKEYHDDNGPWWILPYLVMPLCGVTLILVSTCLFHYSRYVIIKTNLAADQSIAEACTQLAVSSGKDVQYLTMWTGFCRPKGTKSSRAICINPAVQTIGVPASGTAVVGMPLVCATVVMKTCPNCNATVTTEAKFCSSCGTELS